MAAETQDVYPPSYAAATNDDENKEDDVRVDVRALARTPSPTPSEAEALNPTKQKGGFFKNFFNPAKLKDPKELVRLLVTTIVISLVIVFVVFQPVIIGWLKPFADWMKSTPGGWLIPIAIMVVLSFPPLFGHEIIAILCGDVWGIWIGFGIVAAGTILGELANYVVFRCFCMARGRKMEEKNLQYALLTEVVRRGGLLTAIIIRFSALPGHFSTAIFASCGMSVVTFLAAAVISLPQQLATVFVGSVQSGGSVDHKTATIKAVVAILTVAATIFAMRYIRLQTQKVTAEVVYRRRKARQAKLLAATGVQPDLEAALVFDEPSPGPSRGRSVQTVRLDGVTLQVPTPQRASSHGYALDRPPVHPARLPEAYAMPQAPQAGYNPYTRNTSRSPLPADPSVP